MSLTRTNVPRFATIAAIMLGTWLMAGCGSQEAGAPMEEESMPAESVQDSPDNVPEDVVEQAPPDTSGGQVPEAAPEEAAPEEATPVGPKLVPAAGEPEAAALPQATRMAAPQISAMRPKSAITRHPRASASGSAMPPVEAPAPTPSGEVAFSMAPTDEPLKPPAEQSKTGTEEAEESDKDYTVVKVYYGTDRAATGTPLPSGLAGPYPTAFASAITALLLLIYYRTKKRWAMGMATIGLLAAVALGGSVYFARNIHSDKNQSQRAYGNERGELELGTCEVSIPKRHEVGELESPSIIRLEVREDPERHVVLLDVDQRPADEFYKDLGACVADSAEKQAFVFVHGFNVTFEKAARRTAQLAHDLKFDGAPIFYSWPSQGGLLQYAVDETNVVWTVPHLKQFLVDVADRSGAKSVHLIAHSMGNRALTSALRGLSQELGDRGPLFQEVVLTAPDIDADVFRRDIAPAIINTARRVTLYASSNDEALAASKQVHGYPRAGESGDNVVVVPGIDTIDVSAVDTSLLGHSYYGSNDTVLSDLVELLNEARPPDQRTWLQSMPLGPLKYWVFLGERLGLSPSQPPL